MSKGKPTPPDGAKTLGDNDDDDDFELEPGEQMTAQVLSVTPQDTDYGGSAVLTCKVEDGDPDDEVVEVFATGEVKAQYKQGNIQTGRTYWFYRHAEESEFEGNSFYDYDLAELDE
jgi:hypothetical protein